MSSDQKTKAEEIAEKYRRRAAARRGEIPKGGVPEGDAPRGKNDLIGSLLSSAGKKVPGRKPEMIREEDVPETEMPAKPAAPKAETPAKPAAPKAEAPEMEAPAGPAAGKAAETPAEKVRKRAALPPAKDPADDITMRSVSAVKRLDDARRKKARHSSGTWKYLAAGAALVAVLVLAFFLIPGLPFRTDKAGNDAAAGNGQDAAAMSAAATQAETVPAETIAESGAAGETGTAAETGTAEETATASESSAAESAAETTTAVAAEDKPPAIALTFDDGPSDKTTNELLDVLEQYGAHATFFIVGQRVEGNEAIIKREMDLGCELGNHTWSHQHLRKASKEKRTEEISKCTNAIESAVPGAKVTVLRPPYGADNPEIKQEIELPIILWSLDTLDWKTRDADSTVDTILNKTKAGEIILMHDIHPETIAAAKRVIPQLVEKGFKLLTVSELYEYYNEPLKLHVNHTYSGPKRKDED